MTDNRTIKLAIVGALTSASAFIVGGPVMSADEANGAPNSKHPHARSIVAPHIKSQVTPYAPHSKSQVTPYAPHSKSQVTPYAPHSKSQVTPYAPHSKSQVTPYAPHSKSQVTPYAPDTKSQVTPVAPHALSQATQLRDPDALPAGVAERVAAIQKG